MKNHLSSLDLLRGIAAFFVMLFHYSKNLPSVSPNELSNFLAYGEYGVQVFFVISGFIIPLSMFRRRYQINDFFTNIFKRAIRILPTAFGSIFIYFVFYYASYYYLGRPISGFNWPGISIESLLANFLLLKPFIGSEWYNPVMWTLSVEFQFYLLIGLTLPLLTRTSTRIISLISLILPGIFSSTYLFAYLNYFNLGIIIFLLHTRLISVKAATVFFISILFHLLSINEWFGLLVGFITVLVIYLSPNINIQAFSYLGRISYSLYLIHLPVGLITEIILSKFFSVELINSNKLIFTSIYISISIVFAHLYYLIIESYFLKVSKKI